MMGRARAWRWLVLGLVCCLLGACKVELYSGLDERAANEMLAILLAQGIPAERMLAKDKTLTVSVEESRFAEAVQLLKAQGLPHETFKTMGDVFAGDGMISSPVEERARLIYALSQELARTVSEIDGVLSARVHVVLPEQDGLGGTTSPSSASVFVRHAASVQVGALTPQIKLLVSKSIEGLQYDNVTVVLVPVEGAAALPVAADQALTQVAGIWVQQASAGTARLVIYGLAGLVLALLLAGGAYLWAARGPAPLGRPGRAAIKLPAAE